jgi:hypothetical protein
MGAFRYRAAGLLSLLILAVQGCDAPRVESPVPPPSFAKGAAGPSVAAASPASGHQGAVTLDVNISGSGFDNGSQASWQLAGAPYQKIIVNNTRFNSTTSLTANITIAADAATTTYDIAVTTSTGKKGIGAELFTVTYAILLTGVSEGRAISDAGVVAGANGTNAVAWSASTGAVFIAPNSIVFDIDRNGRTIGGKDAAGQPVIWNSLTGAAGTWTATPMSDLGNGGAVRGIVSDAAGDAVMMTGNAFSPSNAKTPIVWTRTEAGWQKRTFATPPGVAGAWGQAINRRGQVVGMDGSSCCVAIYWDSLGASTKLAPLSGARNAAAWSINGDGTIVVGQSGSAVLWRRTFVGGVYGPWSDAVALEATSTLCGKNGSSIAHDVNAAGTVVVGSSCGIAVAWKVSAGVVTSRVLMQGLGPPNQSVALGVNDLAAPLAAGSAKSSAGVYWWGF